VNQFSASAAEIVAGALKDHNRALIVGERTFGKGSVQNVIQIPNRMAAIKVTTSRYYLPSGRCLHRDDTSTEWGVDPHYLIQMTPQQMRNVQEVRQNMDVLWNPGDGPEPAETAPISLLDVDPQLSAAVMLLRLQVAGAEL